MAESAEASDGAGTGDRTLAAVPAERECRRGSRRRGGATVTTMHLPPVVRRGTTSGDGYITRVTPEAAGWAYSGLRIVEFPPGGRPGLATGPGERIVPPVGGSGRGRC